MGSAFETDWPGSNKSKSFLLTKNLYDEWFRYLLGTESQENNKYVADIRIAREAGKKEPKFVDKMLGYRDSIKKILPHLLFTGVDSQKREINFDTSGMKLTFDQLSGGEREIAFLVGQVERFALRTGLLLVDEPELHLNNDLLRSWIGFLKGTVEQGQIWLASHSLEVVEVTGQEASFLLERELISRKVNKCSSLAEKPVVSTLSRSLGTPAFSISALAFVLVEGEEEIGERERFRLLCDAGPNVRYIESGNCREVMRRLDSLLDIAAASNENLKVGGVIDRDWRSTSELQELTASGLFVLGVREVENFFLHPATVAQVMSEIGQDAGTFDVRLLSAADSRAGTWIFDAARTDKAFEKFPPLPEALRVLVHQLTWRDFSVPEVQCEKIVDTYALGEQKQRELLKRHLTARVKSYARIRGDGTLWSLCEGKEVFRSLSGDMGFVDTDAAQRAVMAAWQRRPELVPQQLNDLRAYVRGLVAA